MLYWNLLLSAQNLNSCCQNNHLIDQLRRSFVRIPSPRPKVRLYLQLLQNRLINLPYGRPPKTCERRLRAGVSNSNPWKGHIKKEKHLRGWQLKVIEKLLNFTILLNVIDKIFFKKSKKWSRNFLFKTFKEKQK